ncbi:hypothetical protein HF313_24460 [Massilia atriviolacea]|uniref:Uncharacterized protein n=1 Tax=Massilia atriviolacea TaxID=2495579 RepID=A0A430HJY1_9BURK|nr:hypothetical protein [Massilia atriviolacea]RSZ57837.1 hypothetical protein EJB06_16025 [Massilia atriviolacea]
MRNRDTEFLNVQVKAKEVSEGVFEATFEPPTLLAKRKDCVINYQLVNSRGIKFTGLTVHPADNDQFSVPSLSKSGKIITLNDANTDHNKYQITLYMVGPKHKGSVDPEVINQPETSPPEEDE